jgi:site-specific DNA-methyltransferase (adenine-specific)
MAWLVRLVTPPGGTVLDPFAGSGTTAEACIVEGFRCVLIEKDPAYCELIRKRLRKDIQPVMFGEVAS